MKELEKARKNSALICRSKGSSLWMLGHVRRQGVAARNPTPLLLHAWLVGYQLDIKRCVETDGRGHGPHLDRFRFRSDRFRTDGRSGQSCRTAF
jgi:hypothetical protein